MTSHYPRLLSLPTWIAVLIMPLLVAPATAQMTPSPTDTTLSALTLSSGILLPTFASTQTSYEFIVAPDATEITVAATPNNSGASVAITPADADQMADGHQVDVSSLPVSISVVVTPATGTTTLTYTVGVVAQRSSPSTDPTLSALTLSPGFLLPSFSFSQTSYEFVIEPGATEIRLSWASSFMSSSAITPADADPMAAGYQVDVSSPPDTISIAVTPSAGTPTLTYTVVAVAQTSSTDPTLSALTLSPGVLIPTFSFTRTSYDFGIAPGTTEITVAATPSNSGASVAILPADADAAAGHQVDVSSPPVSISIAVTPATGTTTLTYTVSAENRSDYDADDDGLIEIKSLAQLNAIRWDLNGDGTVADSDTMKYREAFPYAGSGSMGCPATGCTGYELGSRPRPSPPQMGTYTEEEAAHLVSLNFDKNGDNRITSLDSDYWNGGAGWEPIGTGTDSFTAIFNGNNNYIFALFIDRGKTDNVGLFGAVGNTARIDSLNLTARVKGRNNVGGLVGSNNGTISACSVSGSIEANGDAVGGLIGNNADTVAVSYARTSVVGRNSEGIGGLIGSNSGTVTASYSGGYGGVVRIIDSGTSSSTASSKIGGLIGSNSGTVTASYSINFFSFFKIVPGGGNQPSGGHPVRSGSGALGTLVNIVGNPTEIGGLIGSNSGTVTASYWDTETSGRASSAGGTGRTIAQLRNVTTATGIYSDWDNLTLDASGTNDDDPWNFGTTDQYPVLQFGGLLTTRQFFVQPIDYDTDDDGLIEIKDVAQLSVMRLDGDGDGLIDLAPLRLSEWASGKTVTHNDAYFLAFPYSVPKMGCPATGCKGYELAADLSFDRSGDGWISDLDAQKSFLDLPLYDLVRTQAAFYRRVFPNQFSLGSEQAIDILDIETYGFFFLEADLRDNLLFRIFDTYNDGDGWVPIPDFAATFEGNNRTISYLFINRPRESEVGLFGKTRSEARIDSVNLTMARIIGRSNVGSLIGYNRGAVTACSATGSRESGLHLVNGFQNIGGLIGQNDGGTVTDSYATGEIKGTEILGNGGSGVGGLIGYSDQGKITNSHAGGLVIGDFETNYIGGLVGRAVGEDTLTACYATNNITMSNPATTGTGSFTGGLVGQMSNGAVIASYATGNIQSVGDYVGGLIGANEGLLGEGSGSVIASYATGLVYGIGNDVGGLIGLNDGGTVTASYATGLVAVPSDTFTVQLDQKVGYTRLIVSGQDTVESGGLLVYSGKRVGGLIGDQYGTVNHSYWDTDFSSMPDDADNDAPEGKTTTELTTPTTYTGIYSTWNMNLDGTTGNDNPWSFGSNKQYPVLRYSRTQDEINAQFNAQLWRFRVRNVVVTPRASELRVSWDTHSDASGYKVQWKSGTESYDTSLRQATVNTGTSYTIPNLTNGTPYTVRVIAIITNTADGTPSQEVIGTPSSQVQGVEVTPGPASLTVSWTVLSGASGYKVQWKSGTESYDSNTRQATVNTGTSYTIPNLTNGTPYTVRVIATTNSGDGTPSQEVTGTPTEGPPRPESPESPEQPESPESPEQPEQPDPDTEPTFTEAVDPQSYRQDHEIAPLTLPSATGGNGTVTYSLTGLPEGLTFDAETLTVSGTPTETIEKTIYTLTATDEDDDEASLSFFLTVNANLMPSFGDASVAHLAYMRKQEIEVVTLPQATGGDGSLTYALTPDLPEGLTFDAETLMVSGTPTEAIEEMGYTLTATDSDGDEVTLPFTIEVMPGLIPTFGDTTVTAQVYVKHREIDPLTLPQATGGDGSLTYALTPDLPEGLTFDAETLMVSGTPIKAMDEMTYTLTATDSNGDEVPLMFTLEVPNLIPTFGDTTVTAQVYAKHREIAPLTLPAATNGDGMLVYILLPFLPDGLSFDLDTRTISGTPLEEMAKTTYTLSALDVDGDLDSLTFTIDIQPPSSDFDGDGVVNFADFLTFASKFGSRLGQERYDALYDLNGDGEIGFADFLIFTASFGSSG